ncbi:hypothetical protein N5E02_00470 [Stenotrophomonas sp. GD03777]|uniref:hypothetical protein n=1 Tax=Stenotrophomonas TaxID=40323 RepID=UPI0016606262|nr:MULTISPECIES: hypothetical protein [Stenotrophomonas]MDH1659888.1 hypothetical protein [Stenotrophomonas sp. GD03777]
MKDIDERLEHADERAKEFFARFNRKNEYAIPLLQGQLYAEEQLETIVLSVFDHPDCVIDAKLNFWTKTKLAMAVVGGDPQLWSARNELAHGRDAAHLERKIDSLIAAMPLRRVEQLLNAQTRLERMKISVALICGSLARIADNCQRI